MKIENQLLNVFVNGLSSDISWSNPNSNSGMLSPLIGTDFTSTSSTNSDGIFTKLQVS